MNPVKKMIPAVLVFLAAITAIRLLWINSLSSLDYPDPPAVDKGVLDLRGFELNARQTFELNGEWLFYPGVFLMAEEDGSRAGMTGAPAKTIRVPKAWDEADVPGDAKFQHGSYRLRILPGVNGDRTLALRLSRAGNASAVFVNGESAGSSGEPATDPKRHRGGNLPYVVSLPPGGGVLDIVIHVSSDTGDFPRFCSICSTMP